MTGFMSDISRVREAESRSICPENVSGGRGAGAQALPDANSPARTLGQGWKVRPYVVVEAGETLELADIKGPGTIQQIWMTVTGAWRHSILRMYWDDTEAPAVEVPVGDFFCSGWGSFAQLSSLAVCVNPGSAFNCYWPMPFRRRARLTLENIAPRSMTIYYQINYELGKVAEDAAYFHAQFRRSNPLPYGGVHTILDGVRGCGHYVGTYMAWGVNNTGWWGEGEIKFYLDGDRDFPTICGTGTEDYFCGSYNFENQRTHQYQEYTTPYAGLHQVIRPDGVYQSQQRFGMYRWHLTDPVRFGFDLRVTIQALGWRPDGRFLPLQDDIASTAFWYQTGVAAPFPQLPAADELEVI